MPDYVRADPGHPADLPPLLYADPAARSLPLHTKAAAWLSAARLAADPDFTTDPDAHRRVRAALDRFGIAPPAGPPPVKTAAAPAPAGAPVFVREADGWQGARVATPDDADRAVEWLRANRHAAGFDDRSAAAARLAKLAAADGLSPDDRHYCEKLAGYGFHDPRHFAAQLAARRAACGGDPRRHARLDQMSAGWGPDEPPLKLAAAVDAYDRAAGYHQAGYPAGVLPAEEAVFPHTLSEAAAQDARTLVTASGRAYDRDRLAALPAEKTAALFGDAGWEAAAADPQAAAALDRLADAAGVTPLAAPGGITRADLEAWATPAGQ